MNQIRTRIGILKSIIAVVFLCILARLFWLQIIQNSAFEVQAARQQSISGVLKGKRGDIVMHEKDRTIPVATTNDGWLLSMAPKNVPSAERLYDIISKAGLSIDKESFIAKASKPNDPYEVIEHRVSNEIKRRIEESGAIGLNFELEPWRFYPAGTLGAQTIGFVGGDETGQYGIERYYDADLSGKNGTFQGTVTAGNSLLSFGKNLIDPEHDGATVDLTIDAGIETVLSRTVEDILTKYHGKSAGGIIMDPKTGKVLAMASAPSYDPNNYSQEKNAAIFKSPLVEDVFEMGSVMKPLTLAAALDAGAITPSDTYNDTGTIVIDGARIANYDGKARGVVPMQEILSQSLNVGAVHVMEKLGKDKFRDAVHAYGIDEKTGIDLPNEVTGNIRNLQSTRLVEYATASFGQGISMTFFELTRALSSLANGGFLVTPYVVDRVSYPDGRVVEKAPGEPKRILKEDTSRTITRMLVKVVDTKLAGGHGKIPGYSVAAKTGTAQMASSDHRGYSDQFMHTFFGYGPAYDPRFIVVLYIERPQGVQYASETLTEPFRSLIKYLFSYYEVPPDRPQDSGNE